MKKKTLTPLILGGIFFFMLGLSFAAVPLYDLFCRVTGFGGTTQVSKEAPKIVLDNVISVRLDTNVNSNLSWDFKAKKNLLDVKPGKVYNIDFEVQNVGNEPAVYKLVFYLDPELVNDPKTANVEDVTMSYTFFSSDYYKQSKNIN